MSTPEPDEVYYKSLDGFFDLTPEEQTDWIVDFLKSMSPKRNTNTEDQ